MQAPIWKTLWVPGFLPQTELPFSMTWSISSTTFSKDHVICMSLIHPDQPTYYTICWHNALLFHQELFPSIQPPIQAYLLLTTNFQPMHSYQSHSIQVQSHLSCNMAQTQLEHDSNIENAIDRDIFHIHGQLDVKAMYITQIHLEINYRMLR